MAESEMADSTMPDSNVADSNIADPTSVDSTIADSTIADSKTADSKPYYPSASAHTRPNLENHDSVNGESNTRHTPRATTLLTESRLPSLERRQEIGLVVQEGLQKRQDSVLAGYTPIDKREERIKSATVPVLIQIEHCGYIKNATDRRQSRAGTTIASTQHRFSIQTLHIPLEGIYGTSCYEFRTKVRQLYDATFAERHKSHQHPSTQHGDIIMELSINLPGIKLNPDEWIQVLQTLFSVYASGGYGIAGPPVATLTAKFTCPAHGRI